MSRRRPEMVLAANPPPVPSPLSDPHVVRVRDGVVMAGAFAVGAVIGAGVVVHAVGRDLFDRFEQITRR